MSDNMFKAQSARKLHESKEIEDKLLGGKSMLLMQGRYDTDHAHSCTGHDIQCSPAHSPQS